MPISFSFSTFRLTKLGHFSLFKFTIAFYDPYQNHPTQIQTPHRYYKTFKHHLRFEQLSGLYQFGRINKRKEKILRDRKRKMKIWLNENMKDFPSDQLLGKCTSFLNGTNWAQNNYMNRFSNSRNQKRYIFFLNLNVKQNVYLWFFLSKRRHKLGTNNLHYHTW